MLECKWNFPLCEGLVHSSSDTSKARKEGGGKYFLRSFDSRETKACDKRFLDSLASANLVAEMPIKMKRDLSQSSRQRFLHPSSFSSLPAPRRGTYLLSEFTIVRDRGDWVKATRVATKTVDPFFRSGKDRLNYEFHNSSSGSSIWKLPLLCTEMERKREKAGKRVGEEDTESVLRSKPCRLAPSGWKLWIADRMHRSSWVLALPIKMLSNELDRRTGRRFPNFFLLFPSLMWKRGSFFIRLTELSQKFLHSG